MKEWTILGSGLCVAALAACSSSSSSGTPVDGGKDDVVTKTDTGASKGDGGTPKDAAKDHATGEPDTSTPHDAVADAGPDRHVLVTYSGTNPTTMFAVNLETGKTDGTFTTVDFEAVTDTSNATAPFFLNQTEDIVNRLDPLTWQSAGSWSVALPADGGTGGSDPYAVVLGAPTQAYVVRYLSNIVDVFDPTQTTDAGMTSAQIDLSSLVQTGDEDGLVEATAGVFVPATKLLYVVLGNIDRYATDDYMGSFDTICGSTTSTVIAIDTTTNTLKPLGGAGKGGGIALAGYDPTSVVYDAANGRLLIVEAGCNPAPTADGGAPGALKLRGVEAVDLTANTTKILLDASAQGFPGSFVYISPHQAVVGFSYPTSEAFEWDPTLPNLGSQYMNAPQVFDYDGHGNLVGANVTTVGDGGMSSNIVSMSLTDGTVTTLVANVIPVGMAYISSVGVWPRP